MLPADCIGHIHLCDTTMETSFDMFGTKVRLRRGHHRLRRADARARQAYNGEWWAADSIPMGPMAWKDT